VSATEDESGLPGGLPTDGPAVERKKRSGSLREVPVLIVVAFAFALIIKTFVVQAFYIPSASMEPTLVGPGDRVVVNKLWFAAGVPSRGDIVVFHNPDYVSPHQGPVTSVLKWMGEGLGLGQAKDEFLVKRVIGLPGETVSVKDDGVYIDGQLLPEPYANLTSGTGPVGTWRVPDGDVFMMGDNRGNSGDSRFFGPVPAGSIVGKAFFRIWPPSRWGAL